MMNDADSDGFDYRDNPRPARRVSSIETYEILYPERRRVTASWIIGQAKDQLANAYMERNFNAEDAAIEENSRISGTEGDQLLEAMEILSDAGTVTFTQAARDAARGVD